MITQDFMKVYRVLTDELLSDELIAGQPSFSAEYMRKVVLDLLALAVTRGRTAQCFST